MVTKKATTTKKVSATQKKAEVNEKIKKDEVVQEPVIEESKAGKRLSKRKKESKLVNIDLKRIVPVVSVSNFPVGYKCKLDNRFLTWAKYEEEHSMSIEEINMMNGESEDFLHEPWLIVDDEEFVEVYKLTDLYDLIFEIEDLGEFYSQRMIVIEQKLDRLPSNTRQNLLNRTIKMINDGYLDNYNVVKLLKNKYGIQIEI